MLATTTTIDVDQLLSDLSLLCAQPSSFDYPEQLPEAARVVADLFRRVGLQVKTVPTDGAPVVLAWRDGLSRQRLLFYHHYDVVPPGPWRAWLHEPYQLAERDAMLYSRGVAHGKGPLAAHIQALRSLLRVSEELPCGVVFVVEGEGLMGSPHLASVVQSHKRQLRSVGCLSIAGERDIEGRPFCYGGSKGLLRVQLRATGAAHPLPSGLATSVMNPVWRLAWALNNIKGEDEDIRINGFYDQIAGPVPGERELLRSTKIDEAGRRAAWSVPSFLFEMTGAALVRSEVTLPTCNIASFTVDSAGTAQTIPTAAVAQLDFHLVPDQQPVEILRLLRKHLAERGFEDIEITALSGNYPPVRSDLQDSFVQQVAEVGGRVYQTTLPALPLGPFAQPLHVLAKTLKIPVTILGLARNISATHAANEQIPLDDLVRQAQIGVELMQAVCTATPNRK